MNRKDKVQLLTDLLAGRITPEQLSTTYKFIIEKNADGKTKSHCTKNGVEVCKSSLWNNEAGLVRYIVEVNGKTVGDSGK